MILKLGLIRSAPLTLTFLILAADSSRAQMAMPGQGRSLGGYGAATISSYYGGSGGGYMPYAGGGRGFVPYRSGTGGGLGVDPIPRRMPGTPIGGTEMSGSMAGGLTRPGVMSGGRRGAFSFSDRAGAGMSGDLFPRPMPATDRASRARSGPGFGYPFREPPSLSGSSTMALP